MMNEAGVRRVLPGQSSGSGHTFGTPRHPSVIDPILSKRVCFYKSGDPQFNGLRMVINNRTFKTFDALLDSLSKKVPLAFGVRNITTPHGVHAICTLEELEDGKSYICSDSRKVKPFNLARARKKLPPWYHARPVSSRRRTVQRSRFFPGQSVHKKETVFLRTPKKLLVYRNGDPTVKHTVVLHKRTTPNFESILEYISELIQFRVVKLLTPDGKRVDGLPGLILCSGTVVAAGREPFRPADYNAQKSPITSRKSVRRLKALNRQKKTPSKAPKPRKFSPSSERYIVNQIHDSIAERSSEPRSNAATSVEWESSRILESVAETEYDACLADGADGADGAEGHGCLLPTDDDIEKSFRVNQDGSMTVEMKVRLTLKEEETVHWTTTLTRSSVANLLSETSLPAPEEEQDITSPNPDSHDLQGHEAPFDTVNKDKHRDNNDEDPPSPCSGAFSESSVEEDNPKGQMDMVSPKRAPTPGQKHLRKRQTSLETIKSVTAEGLQEDVVGSYSYREQTEHGAMAEQYCLVKQSSCRPVPKPRRLGSLDTNNMSRGHGEMAEVLQVERSREEITETILHIYEQQTYQENFRTNFSSRGISASSYSRPATSDTGQFSSRVEAEPGLRPSTASESTGLWRAGSASLTSDVTLPSLHTRAFPEANSHKWFTKSSKGKVKSQRKGVNNNKKALSKPKRNKKHVLRLRTPKRRQKASSSDGNEERKKMKTFSSAGFLKRIYGTKSQSTRKMVNKKVSKKITEEPEQNGDGGLSEGSVQSEDTIRDPNLPPVLNDIKPERRTLNVAPEVVNQPRGVLRRQASMHQEKKNENESNDISKSMALPACTSSSARTNEYVEHWLDKAQFKPTSHPEHDGKGLEKVIVQTENVQRENKNSLEVVAEEVKSLEEASGTCQNVKSDLVPENVLQSSVKDRIQSFENKLSSPLVVRSAINQPNVHVHTSPKTFHNNNKTQTKNHISSEIPSDLQDEIPPYSETPSNTLSVDFPPPPTPPDENALLSNTEYCVMDESSTASSPLYRLSSVSSQMSDNHPVSCSPTSDKASSPTDLTMERTALPETDVPSTQREPLPRSPSIKLAPLVSNVSLARTMALRNACMDKYTICSDASSGTTLSSAPTTTAPDNRLQNVTSSPETQRQPDAPTEETPLPKAMLDMKDSHLCCTSTSPTSLTSEDRVASASISSGEHTTAGQLQFKETKERLTELGSPKPSMRKVQIISSPSLERKSETKKQSHNSPKLTSLRPPEKTKSPSAGVQPNMSPSTKKKGHLQKQNLSPYSQSLDVVSPPIRRRSNKKSLSRNLSSDDASDSTHKTQRKPSSERKRSQIKSIKSAPELDQKENCNSTAPTVESQKPNNEVDRKDEPTVADEGNLITETRVSKTTNHHDVQSVLEDICRSIKTIRLNTQKRRPSCLERSNSLPDFSSHVASTFGSSSKALLAFLAVMTLKESLTTLKMKELKSSDVSCVEALKMIDSLKEITSIEDPHKLRDSLTDLQKSASQQLLESWEDFKELSDKGLTSNDSDDGLVFNVCQERNRDEKVIDEIMENLDLPVSLKEELASLSHGFKSDNKEKMCPGIMEDIKTKMSHLPIDSAQVEDETPNVDVSSIIKQFTLINQGSVRETAKPKSADHRTEDNQSHHGVDGDGAEPHFKQLYCSEFEIENNRGMQTCCQEEEEEEQQCINEEKSGQEVADMTVTNADEDICTPEDRAINSHQLQLHNGNELTHNDDSGSDGERKDASGANKDLDVSCDGGGSSSEEHEQHSSEGEKEVESEELVDTGDGDDSSEVEEDVQLSFNCYGEVQSNRVDVFTSGSPSKLEKDLQSEAGSMKASTSEGESTDVDEASSEEKQHEGSNNLRVVREDRLSDNEEEQKGLLDDLPFEKEDPGRAFRDVEEDEVSSEDADETLNCEDTNEKYANDPHNLIENPISNNRKDNLFKSDSLAKHRLSTDEDSGNDHSDCDEPPEVQTPSTQHGQISSSIEEELSDYGKESSSEEEQANIEIYIEDSSAKFQEALALALQSDDTAFEKVVQKSRHQLELEEIISQSVAERVTLLETKVADEQKRRNTLESEPKRRSSHRNESDGDCPSELPTSKSAPQSSLSFSYDSSAVITTEPEGRKVQSIREMFLAKSAMDTPQVPRRLPNPTASELAELRAQTSTSVGYESQTSSEHSSGEDDSAKKSISKGFVRRTIERLYGLKNGNSNVDVGDRPPSAPREKKKELSSIFSPFHITSKAMQELSYFNSTSALENLADGRRCIAFNAKVVPGHDLLLDDEHWLFSENTHIRKSVSDPVGINKSFIKSPEGEGVCEDTEQKTKTRSLPEKNSEDEDMKERSFSRMCTYFSLPHASDSEVCQDDLSIVSKSSENGDGIADTEENSEVVREGVEKNGTLPGAGASDFKRMDNKVHPLAELPRDGGVVVVQPGKGQGAINRRLQDPDMLDVLYDFCGQNCPIL